MDKITSINASRFGRIPADRADKSNMVTVRKSNGRVSLMIRRTCCVCRPVMLSRTLISASIMESALNFLKAAIKNGNEMTSVVPQIRDLRQSISPIQWERKLL